MAAATRSPILVPMSTQPNILWVCTDQQRFDTLGCNGNPYVTTPCADALAAEGVRCSNAFCQNPVCTPSRASFLSGRYPRTNRCRANGQAIPEHEVLLPKLLHDAGYLCGLAGKLHISPCNRVGCDGVERRIDDGYTFFDWSHHPGADQPGNAYTRWLIARTGEVPARPRRDDCRFVDRGVPSELHQTTWCIDRCIEQINAATRYDRPWFVSLNCFDPHHPFDPPADYLAPYLERLDDIPLPVDRDGAVKTPWEITDHRGSYGGKGIPGELPDREHRMLRASYWAMCDLIDAQVARLVEHLKAIGQYDNTVIIFTSDHGELLGDHGMYLKGPHLYDVSVKVPLIIRGPGVPAMRLDDPVELLDLPPTICELTGVDPHPGMQGRSLLPRLRGEVDAHREDAYCEFFNANFTFATEANCTMLRTRRYKLVRYHGPDDRLGLLFDLENDPDETTDRYDDPAYAAIRSELTERLADRIALTIDPLPPRNGPW